MESTFTDTRPAGSIRCSSSFSSSFLPVRLQVLSILVSGKETRADGCQVTHAFQAGRYKTWWAFPTMVLCGLMELIGWGARFSSSIDPTLSNPFIIQAVATLVGPTPLIAGDFIILANLIRLLGPKYSRLSPRLYSIIFLTCDIIALVTQTIGGGLAAVANSVDMKNLGTKIALYGVIFQFIAMTVFVYLAIEFLIFFKRDRAVHQKNRKNPANDSYYIRGVMSNKRLIMVIVLFFNMTCLYIRSIYRVAELAEGFGGKIILTQTYFTVFDGEMIMLAMFSLNLGHPGRLLAEVLEPVANKPWQLGEPLNGFRLVPGDDDGRL
ncbi:RTA1-domain-containing protein [Hymenopellis radicata]|nr:RTA1-domain-containing protein [Hymenopellis radicata]